MFSTANIPDLTGRVYLITGGTAGIGYHTVLHLAANNAKVYIGARSVVKAEEAIGKIRELHPKADLHILQMDLMDLASVKGAAEEFLKKESVLHALINNAGIAVTPYALTGDGFEAQLQTNYISHWLLTYLLIPTITKTSSTMGQEVARVVNVSSEGHRLFAPPSGVNFKDMNLSSTSVSPWARYGQSKLAVILHVKSLSEKYGAEGTVGRIWTASVHPGSVDTGLLTNATGFGVLLNRLQPVLRFFGNYISSEQGSLTTLYTSTSSKALEVDPGNYFIPYGKKGKPSKHADDKEMAAALWDWTEKELKTRNLI